MREENFQEVSSWGRLQISKKSSILSPGWRSEIPAELKKYNEKVIGDEGFQVSKKFLAHGQGRSYGDSCLIEGGTYLQTKNLKKFLKLDEKKETLQVECGVTFDELLEFLIPRGYFLPVVPGTKYISLGGAIANDIHGKNHHKEGSFGHHLIEFELVRSNGEVFHCSRNQNKELFSATIGGLGLTGIITWAKFHLKKISSRKICKEQIQFKTLTEFLKLNQESVEKYDYSVAWVDCFSANFKEGRDQFKGIFIQGNHEEISDYDDLIKSEKLKNKIKKQKKLFFDFPGFFLNGLTLRLANFLYYHKQIFKKRSSLQDLDEFFFPLDSLKSWNRMYGRRGFYQYQCLLPGSLGEKSLKGILQKISESGQGSFLAVLKLFGKRPPAGMMSFAKSGLTLALDFPNLGEKTLALFDELDKYVLECGGALYPAKDARMSRELFLSSHPHLNDFLPHLDKGFSSLFWERVN